MIIAPRRWRPAVAETHASERTEPKHTVETRQVTMNEAPPRLLALDPRHPDDDADLHVSRKAIAAVLPPHLASRLPQIFPKLEASEIDRLRRFGSVKSIAAGRLLYRAGEPGPGLFVLLKGRATIVRKNSLGVEAAEIEHGPGQFFGEIGQLSGQPALVDARAVDDVEALLIDPPSLRAVVVAEAELGERIMRALILRRVLLIETRTGGPVLIGAPDHPDMVRLEGFLARNGHPHTALDPAVHPAAAEVKRQHAPAGDELPLVVCPDGTVLGNPTEQELALRLGMLPELDADHVYDVAIVGAGPAGLAAAVYAASEGLSTLVLDTRVIGGQAGASARIENYLGFPTGISGQALAGRAYVQAQKFGAHVAVPAAATRIVCGAPHAIYIDCGMRVRAKTVVVATGAKYRRPDIPDLAKYEGRGVYYWASPIEARLCQQEAVVLVGGGNSAGQAAVFLAGHAAHVHMLIRGRDLARSMSSYLVERIGALANVTLHTQTEIVAFQGGADGLTGVRWRDRRGGIEETQPTRRVFLFVGADPNTGWLADCGVKLDQNGFVCTSPDLSPAEIERVARQGSGRRPLPLETTAAGVFAIGDARAGSTKRVAAAVGEGAAVVAQVHSWLASMERQTAAS